MTTPCAAVDFLARSVLDGTRAWSFRTTSEIKSSPVVVGDRVIYSKYAGTDVKIDGTEYLILREPDVLAKLS